LDRYEKKKSKLNSWNWEFIENEWSITEISTELCDGTPDMIENDLEYWLNDVGYFCPWTARVSKVVKF
jgi:hypothetical protein